jgi:glycosyltransferase involved in cell wall biosynthesis
MRLCISDCVPWDYNVETPYRQPFGGMHSAACHLAVALAELGHEVSFLNHTSEPGMRMGVDCRSWKEEGCLIGTGQARFDAAISLTANPSLLRGVIGPGIPIYVWTGHADDQLAVQYLTHEDARNQWNGFIFASEWQRNSFIQRFGLRRARTAVIRYAIAPIFENRFADAESLASAKGHDCAQLAYTSTPYRGLELLLGIFPLLTSRANLRVYSSMATYSGSNTDAPYRHLYEKCKSTPSVDYIGAVPQPELAAALASVNILAYPNIFPETGCIAVMEAMASGCAIVTSNLGALPETTEGFASLIEVGDDWYEYARKYIVALERAIDFTRSERELQHLWNQVRHINETCTWRVRAKEWASLLEGL